MSERSDWFWSKKINTTVRASKLKVSCRHSLAFAERLAIAIQLATHEERPSEPLVDIEVSFEVCGPKRTRMTLVATDRPGLLKRVGGGLGAANIRLIQAEFSTKDGMVSDTFVVATLRKKRLRDTKQFELRALLSYVH